MASNGVLAFAIAFCFTGLLLICLGFATDYWVDVTVDREALRRIDSLAGDLQSAGFFTDPNKFSRHRGIFKVCYSGNETLFLDNNDDVISGNCLWVEGIDFDSDEDTIGFEDEYDARNHLIRTQIASTLIGMVALTVGVVLSAIGCWKLSPRGLRLAGLVVFLGAFFSAVGMGAFHGYDYYEREEISQPLQGLFPKYWESQSSIERNSKMEYGWSYIVSWVGVGLSVLSSLLLLCAAYNVSFDEDYTKYSEKKLKDKVEKSRRRKFLPFFTGPAGPAGPSPPLSSKGPIYVESPPTGPPPIVEVPVEVPVAVPVEPPPVYPVIDYDDGGYSAHGYGKQMEAYSAYGDTMPYGAEAIGMYGPAPYGIPDPYHQYGY